MIYIFLLVGLAVGYGMAYVAHGRSGSGRKTLELALAEKKRELEDYQTQVALHFDRTASLVENLQAQHETMITHLCEGARTLRPQLLSDQIPPKDYWITGSMAQARDS